MIGPLNVAVISSAFIIRNDDDEEKVLLTQVIRGIRYSEMGLNV